MSRCLPTTTSGVTLRSWILLPALLDWAGQCTRTLIEKLRLLLLPPDADDWIDRVGALFFFSVVLPCSLPAKNAKRASIPGSSAQGLLIYSVVCLTWSAPGREDGGFNFTIILTTQKKMEKKNKKNKQRIDPSLEDDVETRLTRYHSIMKGDSGRCLRK